MENIYDYLNSLSLEELAILRKESDGTVIAMVDSIICGRTFTDTYVHKWNKKNREDCKLRIKQKINKSFKRDNKKNWRG